VKAYEIKLSGCDDSTRFVMDLDDAEAALLERVAARSQEASSYGCEPRMYLTTPPPEEDEF
jgi:hypothetical protein